MRRFSSLQKTGGELESGRPSSAPMIFGRGGDSASFHMEQCVRGTMTAYAANADSIRRMSSLYRMPCRSALPLHHSFYSPGWPLDSPGRTRPIRIPRRTPKSVRFWPILAKSQTVGQTSLSPDGKHLAWTERGHDGPGRIMVSDARGEGAQQLDIGNGLHGERSAMVAGLPGTAFCGRLRPGWPNRPLCDHVEGGSRSRLPT